jgi:DNA-binding response OmpR family regulator
MIVIVEDRDTVKCGYTSGFQREGISVSGLSAEDLGVWLETVSDDDIPSIEAFLLGDCQQKRTLAKCIRRRSSAAVIALSDQKCLDETLDLFDLGVDDVIGKPVHVREILARIKAIQRRVCGMDDQSIVGNIRVFSDGRDPEIDGKTLRLPRRERRILEYLASNQGRRVTKQQIFNFVYGLMVDDLDENVIESHISKLRKRLRNHLDYDPIDSQRYLGYRMVQGSAGL